MFSESPLVIFPWSCSQQFCSRHLEGVGYRGSLKPIVKSTSSTTVWKWQRWSYKYNLEKHLLVHLHKSLIPLVDVGGFLAGIRVIIIRIRCVTFVMSTPLDHFFEDDLIDLTRLGIDDSLREVLVSFTYIRDRNRLVFSKFEIFHHILD